MSLDKQNDKSEKNKVRARFILRRIFPGTKAFIIVVCLFILIGSCNSKVKVAETTSQYFTINGKELMRDVTEIPDSLDNDVFQANVNELITFQGNLAISPDDNQWYIDGNLIEKGNNQFEHSFEFPGLYQIKHCHGSEKCATRYSYIRKSRQLVEEVKLIENVLQEEPVAMSSSNKEERKTLEPVKVQLNPYPPETTEPPKPVETPIEKPVLHPPKNFKNSLITGFSSGSYKSDCATWVETASLRLKPNEFCLLHTAVIFGSGAGKARINLSDGEGYNESMSILLTGGKTQFAFADLNPVLYPDKVYSLTVSTIAGQNGEKPKIGNISSCKASAKKTSALGIDYGSADVLFDINYKVK